LFALDILFAKIIMMTEITAYEICQSLDLTTAKNRYMLLQRLPKEDILEMIHSLDEPLSMIVYKGTTMLHLAIKYGDTEIINAILSHESGMELLERLDDKGQPPVKVAIDQGHVINAVIIFQATLKYFFDKCGLEYASFTPSEFRKFRQQEPKKENIWQIALDYAQHNFYMFLQEQLADCLSRENILYGDVNERIIEHLRLLAKEFCHDNWIGEPDETAPYEALGLTTNEEIEDFLLDWCETNPVAAMRLYIPFSQKNPEPLSI